MSMPAAPEESKGKIGSKVLVSHDLADAWIAPEAVTNLRAKLEESGMNSEVNSYGGARDGFANLGAGQFGIENLGYNKQVYKRS